MHLLLSKRPGQTNCVLAPTMFFFHFEKSIGLIYTWETRATL